VNAPPKPFFLQALDALKAGDRRGAAALLGREVREGNTSAENLPSVAELAAHIGEIELAIDASRRAVTAGSIDSLLTYWGTLASYGRAPQALAELQSQPDEVREHPYVLHFRGTAATEAGQFGEAEQLFRRALAKKPTAASWLSLAMIKKFDAGDPDIAAMEAFFRQPLGPQDRASLCYALGKAAEDCGDVDRAFELYERGAVLRQQASRFDIAQYCRAADDVVATHTAENLAKLVPSQAGDQRSLFVTGLPRSGTTLTEQILLGHSRVSGGGEVNLFAPALIPTLGARFANALGYQQRSGRPDPWGEIGRDYAHLIDLRFGSSGLVVDKSLGQSLSIGLMLHALPNARIAWLRRSPEDVALSCFRTPFATGLPWTWSLSGIADYMRAEDRLFEHWRAIFADRILVVPYEELVTEPGAWAERLQHHFGLAIESGIETLSRSDRAIGTSSVTQAREPISPARIGQAAAFERHLQPFRDRYYA
jgi:tetratricopeptide (TPR) repeat protein